MMRIFTVLLGLYYPCLVFSASAAEPVTKLSAAYGTITSGYSVMCRENLGGKLRVRLA